MSKKFNSDRMRDFELENKASQRQQVILDFSESRSLDFRRRRFEQKRSVGEQRASKAQFLQHRRNNLKALLEQEFSDNQRLLSERGLVICDESTAALQYVGWTIALTKKE